MLKMSQTVPVYLNNRNWLTPLLGMIEYLKQLNTDIIIIDNDSTYEPLLDFYASTDVTVMMLGENGGFEGPWAKEKIVIGQQHLQKYGHPYYVASDPDLDLTLVPKDVLVVLAEGRERYPWGIKCGLSLEINDLPEDYLDRDIVVTWESFYWTHRLDERYFDAPLGHTFAMYDCRWPYHRARRCDPAVRTDRPYTARHLPWYFTKNNLTEEALYYIEHAAPGQTGLRNPSKPGPLQDWVEEGYKAMKAATP